VRKRNVDDDLKQTGEFCEYCVPRNHTIVQVLFRIRRTEWLFIVRWFTL